MPIAPARICIYCGQVSRGECGCRRPHSALRGYDKQWRKFRVWFLAKHPQCTDCDELSTEVHHILKISEDPRLRLDEANCMALCKACHSKRTRAGE